MKQRVILIAILICILAGHASLAYATPTSDALTYLTSTQSPDGSWGDAEIDVDNLPATAAVLETLKALGQTAPASYINGIVWLQTQSLKTTDYYAQRVLALSTAGSDISAVLSYLDELQYAWGGYADFDANNLDTSHALQALKAVNHPDLTTIGYALGYLLDTQNTDGGWGFYQGDDSNVFMTATVLQTLAQYKPVFNLETEIDASAAYLLTKQSPDGGFGSSPSTAYETALAIRALVTTGMGTLASIQQATDYLAATQLSNGSWDDDAYSTALAIRALAEIRPNLTITSSDISFSNPTPTAGDTITVTANVRNTGPGQAGNVVVRFYDGIPGSGGSLIGEAAIPAIAPYGSGQTSVRWTVAAASTKPVSVVIDPDNAIDELIETDNSAYRSLTTATLPDLSITSADIDVFPPAPDPYIMVGIVYKVRNLGETDAVNVRVDVYDGDPAGGGVKLPGGGMILSIPAGSSAEGGAAIAPENVTGPAKTIHVIVDPANALVESNEGNNRASKTFSIGGDYDLSLSASEISISPLNPRDGDTVTIMSAVRNHSRGTVRNVVVRHYIGDPASGGTPIGQDSTIAAIGFRESATASLTWNTAGHQGNTRIYAVVDPDNTIAEINEYNNRAYKTLKIATSQGPDLTLAASDITTDPSAPRQGDLVTILANIRNIGNQPGSNALVLFRIHDPNTGVAQIIGDQLIPAINPGSAGTVEMSWDTANMAGDREIRVEIDPFNSLPELNEANNEAQRLVVVTTPQGPDIAINAVDTAAIISSVANRSVSGSAAIRVTNRGSVAVPQPFTVTAFEDRNNNRIFDLGTDSIIGQTTYAAGLAAGQTGVAALPLTGTVLTLNNPIYVLVDSSNVVTETDETNNTVCLAVFTSCRNVKVDRAIKTGASWLIAHQVALDTGSGMKAWAPASISYNALAVKAYRSTGRTSNSKYQSVRDVLVQMQAPDGSWDESVAITANAVIALLYTGTSPDSRLISDAAAWILRVQNADGGGARHN